MRTYSGHSTAQASNDLYRSNLEKGQTGLSVAFDLPTQTGYDPHHPGRLGARGSDLVRAPAPVPVRARGTVRARPHEHPSEDRYGQI